MVIDNFLTKTECRALLEAAEANAQTSTAEAGGPYNTHHDPKSHTPWAKYRFGTGGDISRNCGRIVWDTPPIAQKIFARVLPFLDEAGIATIFNRSGITAGGEVHRVTRLNERLRFLRYERGEFFKPHWDATYESLAGETSLFTVHLYLNGDGDQDLVELETARQACAAELGEDDGLDDVNLPLLGGATSFQSGSTKDVIRILPKTGSLLVFQQKDLLHAGDDIYRGIKYTMRTEILYRKDSRFQ